MQIIILLKHKTLFSITGLNNLILFFFSCALSPKHAGGAFGSSEVAEGQHGQLARTAPRAHPRHSLLTPGLAGRRENSSQLNQQGRFQPCLTDFYQTIFKDPKEPHKVSSVEATPRRVG